MVHLPHDEVFSCLQCETLSADNPALPEHAPDIDTKSTYMGNK